MYYAIAEGHPAIAQLMEVSDSIAEHREPRSMGTAAEVADLLLTCVPGAPDGAEFDVIALESEDNDVHVLLRRRKDGLLARASYIEGDDLGDDLDIFELVTDENKAEIVGRFDRWCQFNLEEVDDAAYKALISDMIPIEETAELRLTTDLLTIAPALGTLENLLGQIRTEELRQAVSDAVNTVRAATKVN